MEGSLAGEVTGGGHQFHSWPAGLMGRRVFLPNLRCPSQSQKRKDSRAKRRAAQRPYPDMDNSRRRPCSQSGGCFRAGGRPSANSGLVSVRERQKLLCWPQGLPALGHLVMGASSGKFSVTRLTVTTVLTTTEVTTALSAMNICTKYGAHKITIKRRTLWRRKSVLQELSQILTSPASSLLLFPL